MRDIFQISRNPDNLRQNSRFSIPQINTVVYHGSETVSNFGPKTWDLVPSNLKKVSDLDKFKKAIKQWKTESCPCRLRKTCAKCWFSGKNNLKEVVVI